MKHAMEELEEASRSMKDEFELVELFQFLSDICAASEKPVVLMIDEVDMARIFGCR